MIFKLNSNCLRKTMALEITILTLNVWGIPYISKDREVRMKAIGDELSKGDFDIVSLQELWSESDFQYLKKVTENVLPYAHYFYSGVAGSGLCILSKYPIISAFFHSWSVNGYVHRIQHGDWFGGKGVGLCKIKINDHLINVYTAHLHAEYDRNCDDYLTHRVIQAFDTAQFIENTRGESSLQILAGDLNTEPGDLAYRVLLSESQLVDSFNGKLTTGTNECVKNTYTPKELIEKLPNGKRIDFIMYRAGRDFDGSVKEYMHPSPELVPGENFSYSDHEAVLSKIVVQPKVEKTFNNCSKTNCAIALQESIDTCNDSLKQLESHRRSYLVMALGIVIILFSMIDILPPYGLKTLYLVLKILLSGLIIFFVFMATLWNGIEKHGILAGKISMELSLRNFQNN